jgi:hypothetical protein
MEVSRRSWIIGEGNKTLWSLVEDQRTRRRSYDALPSSLLNPLEGLSMLNCGKLELEGRSRFPTLKGVRRGVLEVPGLD